MAIIHRSRIASALSRLPLTSAVIGPPRGYCSDISRLSAAECRLLGVLKPARRMVHGIPDLGEFPDVAARIHSGFASRAEPAQCLYSLPDARVVGGHFGNGIITRKDRFLLDQHEDFGQPLDGHPIRTVIKLPALRRLSGTSLSLLARWSDNYWHWLYDVLGKLLLLRDPPGRLPAVDHFLVSNIGAATYKMQSLQSLGVDPACVVDVGARSHLRCDNLLVAGRHCGNPYPEQDVIDALRKAFQAPAGEASGGGRIYVSRSKATSRRIANESGLEAVLSEFGFRKVFLEDMDFMAQIRVFQECAAVFCQHGAGLANLVFARPGTAVFELFEPEFVNPCYAFLSHKLGLRYHMLFSTGSRRPEVTFHWEGIPETVAVDPGMVRSVLAQAARTHDWHSV